MTTYELKNIAILNIKGIDYRCILWGIRTTLRFHVNGKFNDYSSSPKIRQILLQVICYDFLLLHIKMSYYWFKRQELFKKVKDRYHISGSNEKVAEYYIANKDVLEVKIIQKLVRKRKKSKKKT